MRTDRPFSRADAVLLIAALKPVGDAGIKVIVRPAQIQSFLAADGMVEKDPKDGDYMTVYVEGLPVLTRDCHKMGTLSGEDTKAGFIASILVWPEDERVAKTLVNQTAHACAVSMLAKYERLLAQVEEDTGIRISRKPKVAGFTTAQVHVAMEAMKNLSGIDSLSANSMVNSAASVIAAAFSNPGWTGEAENCPAFGITAEGATATIDRFEALTNRYANVSGIFQAFIQNIIDHSAPGEQLHAAASEVMRQAERVSQGLPMQEEG